MSKFYQQKLVCMSPEPLNGFRPNLVYCILGISEILDGLEFDDLDPIFNVTT